MKQAFYYQTQVLQELWQARAVAVGTQEPSQRQDRRGESARDGRDNDG